MAKKQNKNAMNKKKVNPNTKPKVKQNVKPKVTQNKTTAASLVKANKGPSKNEILFFKIGIFVISIGLVVAAIVMIVSFFMNKEEENPYIDYNHFQTDELVEMTKHVTDTIYGELDYFYSGKEQYKDFRVILEQNTVFYFYFYNSTKINEDIQTEIDKLNDVEKLPLLFIDLSKPGNMTMFENEQLAHLKLVKDIDNMLLTYDMEPDSADERFKLDTKVSDIIATIVGNL